MSSTNPESNPHISALNDHVGKDVDDIAAQLQAEGSALTEEQDRAIRAHRAQIVVDLVQAELTKREAEAADRKRAIHEEWVRLNPNFARLKSHSIEDEPEQVSDYFDLTMPQSRDDLMGIEHFMRIYKTIAEEEQYYEGNPYVTYPFFRSTLQPGRRIDNVVVEGSRREPMDPDLSDMLHEHGYTDFSLDSEPLITAGSFIDVVRAVRQVRWGSYIETAVNVANRLEEMFDTEISEELSA